MRKRFFLIRNSPEGNQPGLKDVFEDVLEMRKNVIGYWIAGIPGILFPTYLMPVWTFPNSNLKGMRWDEGTAMITAILAFSSTLCLISGFSFLLKRQPGIFSIIRFIAIASLLVSVPLFLLSSWAFLYSLLGWPFAVGPG